MLADQRSAPSLWDQPWSAPYLRGQASARLHSALAQRRPIALLGAGRTGVAVARCLGTAATCFLDDTPAKQGTRVEGLPVWPVDEGLLRLPAGALVLVCIFSAHHRFVRTRERLQRRHDVEVASFAEALHRSGRGLPNLFIGPIEHQVRQRPRYDRLRERLADERSREVLHEHLRMRLLSDFASEPDPRDALGLLGVDDSDALSFVDGGAFDGDTLRGFLTWRGERFTRIVAFEPDPGNMQRLRHTVRTLPAGQRARIDVREQALWSSCTRLAFDAGGEVGSTFGGTGDTQVQTSDLATLDDLPDPLFVKLDVEGAEGEVLRGGEAWIRRRLPLLAVSVYHRPDDLLDLFELIDGWSLPYRYRLRCHGGDGTDLMLYCVSDTASRTAVHTVRTAAASR